MTQQNTFFFQTNQYSTEIHRVCPNIVETLDHEYFFKDPSQQIIFDVVSPQSDFDLFGDGYKLTMKHSFKNEQKFNQLIAEELFSELQNDSQTSYTPEEIEQTSLSIQQKTKNKKIKKLKNTSTKKVYAKSQITKNACCNIVQKTISLIKNGQYEDKLSELCIENEVQIQKFKKFIINEKTRFTGTKALQIFLETKNTFHTIFAKFLKWFLKQKYIRHALTGGQMNNLQAYIEFKNSVILPLL